MFSLHILSSKDGKLKMGLDSKVLFKKKKKSKGTALRWMY